MDLAVVLRVEDVVNGREADVLVAAAVARDEVTVEQFVVVFRASGPVVAIDGTALPTIRVASCCSTPPTTTGRSVVRDVIEEGVSGADRACRLRSTC